MANRTPPLGVLRSFVAILRHGGVTRAAAALHLTPGAVSRALKEMEAELARPLFVRAGRALVPTPIARQLADELEAGLAATASALDRARATRVADRPIVLSCEPTFLIRWLIPRLDALQAAIGDDRDVRLVSAGGPVDFDRDGVDLAIRRADFPMDPAIRAETFLTERVGPVVAPRTAAAECMGDRIDGTLLHNATRPDGWAHWSTRSGIVLAARRELRFEHFYQSLQAAVAGAGAAIGPVALVADDLAAGVLTAPYGFLADGSHYVLMAPRGDARAPLFDHMREWLVAQVAGLTEIAQ